jgi:predicted small lipoprotein YifL
MAPANIVSSTARILRPVLLCLLLAGAAGCGNKGPLYLPESPSETAPEAPEEADAEDEQDRQRDLS